MSEPAAGARGAITTWLKTTIASVFALLSGAVLMYASPLVDRVIKPAKPLANFQWAAEGLSVTFSNRSTGGTEGLWDFGDGSALEPYTPGQDTVVHVYPRPGQYNVKLSLQNLLDEKNERAVSVNLDATGPVVAGQPPTIDAFEVTPIGQDGYAPATYKITSKFKNANLCVWALGHEHPLEIVPAASAVSERLVTFKQPGTHVIKLAVSNGKDVVERNEVVKLKPSPANLPLAVLLVSREVIKVESKEIRPTIALDYPPTAKEATYKFTREIPAVLGYEIAKAEPIPGSIPASAKDVKVQIAADKKSVKFTCDVLKPTGGILPKQQRQVLGTLQLVVTMEKHTPTILPPQQVVKVLQNQRPTVLPLPALPTGWTLKQNHLSMQLVNNNAVVKEWQQLPQNSPVPVNGRNYSVSARIEANNQVRVDMTEIGGRPGGN